MPSKKPLVQATASGRKAASRDELEQIAEAADFMLKQSDEDELSKASKESQPGRISSNPEDDLGARLQETRESMRLTQGELSTLTASLDSDEKGISRAVISLYESGKNRPSPKELRLLCEALKVTPNYLIYGDEHPFDTTRDYERLGTLRRHDPEGFAWMAYIMSTAHHNHYDAVMKLILDLARGWNKSFDKGLQDKANENLIDMARQLQERLEKRTSLSKKAVKK
jgi:transcriptional regulator with XRE-family HTH domain